MAYVKGMLFGTAAILAVLFVPTLMRFFGEPEKATGHAFVKAGFLEALLSPLFWIEVFCVLALFLVTSRLGSKALRVVLFWIPAIAITTLGCAVIGLFTFVFLHFRR
jgi:hypothetical protein